MTSHDPTWGDDEFEAVYRKETPGLIARAMSFGLDMDYAQDIAHESWLIFAAKCRSDPPDDPIPYLYGIAGNLSRKRWREIRRERPTPMAPEDHPEPAPNETDAVDHERAVWQELHAAGLARRQREAVYLVDYQRFTYEEAAVAMGVSKNTVKKHLDRGRLRLRRWRERRETDSTQEEDQG